MKRQLGIFLPTMSHPSSTPGDVVAAAQHAERLGFESVWAVDQLIAGTGAPFIESTVALAAAAGATTRIKLGFGVMILPLRDIVWVAKQVASLQFVSGGRVLFGIGAGGDRHDRSWAAVGVPRRERGRRTDDALRVLPDLIAGRPAQLPGVEAPPAQLSPGVDVPPILVGGMSEAAMRRAVDYGDDWFLLPVPPSAVRDATARLRTVASERARPVPTVTGSMLVAMNGDPALPGDPELHRLLTDPDGQFGMPPDAALETLVRGEPADIAARLAKYRETGAGRVVISVAAGNWYRQAELVAEAWAMLE